MEFGLDYVTGPSIAAMKSANPPVDFVCRYLSEVNAETEIKLLTLAEAKTLGVAGIAIVSNYEWYGNRAAEGYASGVYDAQIADAQHKACGGPADRPIYFSVDFDTGATAAIIDYFHGVASVIGRARTGAYGGYACVKGLLDVGAIIWGWQTYAWSGDQWDPRAQLQQYENGVTFGGRSVDYDRSMTPDFGQWLYGGTMIPTGWKDNGAALTAPNNVPVVLGFRQHILEAPTWDVGNEPQEAEYHAAQVLLHNRSVGAGQVQVFRDTLLWYTADLGVRQEPYLGLEIQAAYTEIATLQAEIAALKQQPPARPVDTSALVAAINAIPDAIAPSVAAALVEAKKL